MYLLLRQIEQVWLEKDDGYALRTRALLLLVLSRSLAEQIGLNPVYLGHLFHRQNGQTIHRHMDG